MARRRTCGGHRGAVVDPPVIRAVFDNAPAIGTFGDLDNGHAVQVLPFDDVVRIVRFAVIGGWQVDFRVHIFAVDGEDFFAIDQKAFHAVGALTEHTSDPSTAPQSTATS